MLHGPTAGLPLTAAPPPLPATRAALRARLVVRLKCLEHQTPAPATGARSQPLAPQAQGGKPTTMQHYATPRRHTSACEQQWVCQCDTGSRRLSLAPLVGSWRPLGSGASGVHSSTTSSGREGADRPVRDIAQPGVSRCPAKVSTLDGSITIRRAPTNPVGQVAHLRASSDAETSGDEVSGAIDVAIPGALDRSTDSIWRAERDLGLAEIARELRRRTRNPGDRERLARGMAGAAAAFDWQYLFGSQTSFTAEKLRRIVARRIVEALQGNAARPTKPRSDNLDQMWRGFSARGHSPSATL